MKNGRFPILCLAIPLVISALLVASAMSFYAKTARLKSENDSCRAALASLAPYLERLSEYRVAEEYLDGNKGKAVLPEMPMGISVPARTSSRNPAGSDEWASLREEYSWNSILPGQAFAVLAKFTASDVALWRIVALDMSSTDDDKVSLSVTLESAERTQE